MCLYALFDPNVFAGADDYTSIKYMCLPEMQSRDAAIYLSPGLTRQEHPARERPTTSLAPALVFAAANIVPTPRTSLI